MTVEEIRRLKETYGYSNARLSDESGVPLGTVNKVLSGASRKPRYETLWALWNTLKKVEERSSHSPAAYDIDQLYRRAPQDSLVKEEALKYGISDRKGPGEFTLEDYYAVPEEHRVELIDGVFYDMAAPDIRHQRIALELAIQLELYVRSKGGPCVPMISPVDVKLDDRDDKTIVQPDVLVVCNPDKIHEKLIVGAPDFVAEIVSPSSSGKDYYKKMAKYRQTGVREYWVIDPMKARVTVFGLEKEEPPEILPLQGKLAVKIYDGELEIDLDALGRLL